MKDLMIMLASVMPDEFLIERLDESIQVYKLDKSDNNRSSIQMYCMMILGKRAADDAGGADALMQRMERHERTSELLNNDPLNTKSK